MVGYTVIKADSFHRTAQPYGRLTAHTTMKNYVDKKCAIF